MKQLVLMLFLFAANALTAQEKEVGDFNKITAFDKIDVLLIPSEENKVILKGKGSEEVELINNNGELKIRMPLNKLMKGDDVSATVYYTNLEAVEANEGSRIASESEIKTTNFDIIVKEGSVINLTLDVAELHVKINDGGKVNLIGKAAHQDVLLNTGSIYKAEQLHSDLASVTANAGAEAFVNVSDNIDAKVRAGGKITIYGKPKNINRKVIAGGKIYEKDE